MRYKTTWFYCWFFFFFFEIPLHCSCHFALNDLTFVVTKNDLKTHHEIWLSFLTKKFQFVGHNLKLYLISQSIVKETSKMKCNAFKVRKFPLNQATTTKGSWFKHVLVVTTLNSNKHRCSNNIFFLLFFFCFVLCCVVLFINKHNKNKNVK